MMIVTKYMVTKTGLFGYNVSLCSKMYLRISVKVPIPIQFGEGSGFEPCRKVIIKVSAVIGFRKKIQICLYE